jgi:hypothetical protein
MAPVLSCPIFTAFDAAAKPQDYWVFATHFPAYTRFSRRRARNELAWG